MSESKLKSYGGSALIEGVMMRGSLSVALAMRAPNQEIVIKTEPLGTIYRSKFTKIPFLRGLVLLWDALGLGMKALTVSANLQTGEDEKLEGAPLFFTILFAIALAVGMFFLLPAGIGHLAVQFLGMSDWWSNVLEGVLRLVILILYLAIIGRMPEIARVFAYHGAEHKTINAYEAGSELTPEKVSQFPIEHTRCGTAFLLDVVFFSIILFGILGPLPIEWRLISRVLLIPVIAGIAYEYMRWTANHIENSLVCMIAKPNLALQHLTTREPSKDMLEVAIASFHAMRKAEEDQIIL